MVLDISYSEMPVRSIGIYCISETKNTGNNPRLVKIGFTSSNLRMRVFGYGICFHKGYYLYEIIRCKDSLNKTKPKLLKDVPFAKAHQIRMEQRAWLHKIEQELFAHLKDKRFFPEHNPKRSEWFTLTIKEIEQAFQWVHDKYPDIFEQPQRFTKGNYLTASDEEIERMLIAEDEQYIGAARRTTKEEKKQAEDKLTEGKRVTRSLEKSTVRVGDRPIRINPKFSDSRFWK